MTAPPITMPTNTSTSATRSKRRGTPSFARTSQAMAQACTVLPLAIKAEPSSAPSTLALAAKLPIQTAGHSRHPPRSSAASAMPDGGQMAVA